MKLKARDIAIFAMLGALMIGTKKVMEFIPNVHLLGMFIVSMTAVYRVRALIPIYVYVFLDGLMGGFSTWWWPYLYIWAVLWGMTMLIPQRLPEKVKNVLYIGAAALHGYAFGLLYALFEALLHGQNLQGLFAWWLSGLPYDFIHGTSNLICGLLIAPMTAILKRVSKPAVKN